MARALRITVKGLAEVNAKLRQMDDSISARSMRALLLECADVIRLKSLSILRSVSKRSTKNRSGWGHLEDAIVAQSGKSETYMKAWAKTIHRMAPQGIWLEFGHRIVGHKRKSFTKGLFGGSRDTGKRTTPKPFFRPAVDQTRVQVRNMIRDGIKRALTSGASRPGTAPEDTGWIG